MEEKKTNRRVQWFGCALLLLFIYKIIDKEGFLANFASIIMPFILGILVAYLLYIPCKKIEELFKKIKGMKKVARGLSILIVYLITIMIIVIIVNIVLPTVYKSIAELAGNMPSYYQSALKLIEEIPDESIIKKESIQEAIYGLQKVDIANIISLENIMDYLKSAMGAAGVVFNIFVTIVMSVYILIERGKIYTFLKKLSKALFKEKSQTIDDYFVKSNNIFFKYIATQIADAILVGVIVSIAMSIMKVKYAVLLGFMIGLFNLIPYFGAIISITIAAIITAFTGGIGQAIWLLVIVVTLQQIDANILYPKIVGQTLKLSPILVISSITIFGAYFGVLGMFLAVPIIAVIKLLVVDYIDSKTTEEVK